MSCLISRSAARAGPAYARAGPPEARAVADAGPAAPPRPNEAQFGDAVERRRPQISEYRMLAYFGRMISTAFPRSSSSRLRPDTTSPSPPASAAGAHSDATITTYITHPPRCPLNSAAPATGARPSCRPARTATQASRYSGASAHNKARRSRGPLAGSRLGSDPARFQTRPSRNEMLIRGSGPGDQVPRPDIDPARVGAGPDTLACYDRPSSDLCGESRPGMPRLAQSWSG